MPFPLAHPAAIIPLRRYKCFDFSALVIGSIIPDLGYLSGPLHLEDFSHTITGAFVFCLPLGLFTFWLIRRLGYFASSLIPKGQGLDADRQSSLSSGDWTAAFISILAGASTHLIWDGFTHKGGWFVQHIPLLQLPIAWLFGHQLRIFHVLWYASSFAAVSWLYILYERWRWMNENANGLQKVSVPTLTRAFLVGIAAVLVGVVHHLIHHWEMPYLVGLLTFVLAVSAALWVAKGGKVAN